MNYSHFEHSAVCSSPGLFVGAEGSEVRVASASGLLYQSGSAVNATAAELNKLDNLTLTTFMGHVSTNNLKFEYGSCCASPTCTIDTGLTAVNFALTEILGKALPGCAVAGVRTSGATLDTPNTPDGSLSYEVGLGCHCQYRISSDKIWVKAYKTNYQGGAATLDGCTKSTAIRWLAVGT